MVTEEPTFKEISDRLARAEALIDELLCLTQQYQRHIINLHMAAVAPDEDTRLKLLTDSLEDHEVDESAKLH